MSDHKNALLASMTGLAMADVAKALGLSQDAVLQAERNGELFSVAWPARDHTREYPWFQTWPELQGGAGSASPLARVLRTLGAPATDGSSLYGFFCSTNDLLGDSTPVEVLAGRIIAKRTLDPEALELVNSPPERRYEAVLSAAWAYAADLAA
ncbi:MAG: hypothetical protein KF891_11745 [Rhizobacter sp.]|nr:hypothetical protein [Rhizobacter sp.]